MELIDIAWYTEAESSCGEHLHGDAEFMFYTRANATLRENAANCLISDGDLIVLLTSFMKS